MGGGGGGGGIDCYFWSWTFLMSKKKKKKKLCECHLLAFQVRQDDPTGDCPVPHHHFLTTPARHSTAAAHESIATLQLAAMHGRARPQAALLTVAERRRMAHVQVAVQVGQRGHHVVRHRQLTTLKRSQGQREDELLPVVMFGPVLGVKAPKVRAVQDVEAEVHKRETPRLAAYWHGARRVELPAEFLVLVEKVVRLQSVQEISDVHLELDGDHHVHFVIPRNHAVVAPGPQKGPPVHEEGDVGGGQGVGEHVKRL